MDSASAARKPVELWKKPGRLRQLGYLSDFLKIRKNCWRNSRNTLASCDMPNAELIELKLYDVAEVETVVLSDDL